MKSNVNKDFIKTNVSSIINKNDFKIRTDFDNGYYILDDPGFKTDSVSIIELIEHKKEIDEKINNFLSFLEMKGIIKKDEFNDFLESLNIAKKMEE